MHIIIIGAGKTGKHVIEASVNNKHEVYVIEKRKKVAEWAAQNFDCVVINSDATSMEALHEANAEKADAIIVTTSDDAVNSLIILLAKRLGVERLISSVNSQDHIALFEDLGIQTVESPYRLNGKHLYRAVEGPNVKQFLDLGDNFEVLEMAVEEGSKIFDKTVEDLKEEDLLPNDTLIILIKRDEEVILPDGEACFKANDVVVMVSKEDKIPDVSALFDTEEEDEEDEEDDKDENQES